MTVDQGWPFYHPVIDMFFFKSAGIADPVVYLTPLVLPCCYTQYFLTSLPERYFSATGRTIAMGFNRLRKPYPVLETECAIGECSHRANVNNVADEFIIERFFDISSNLRMVAPRQNSMMMIRR